MSNSVETGLGGLTVVEPHKYNYGISAQHEDIEHFKGEVDIDELNALLGLANDDGGDFD